MGLHKDYDGQFARFWYVYPRKEGKPEAEKEFLKLKLDEADVDELIRHVEIRKTADKQWVPNEKGNTFVPYAERFLKHRRFEDIYERVAKTSRKELRSYDVEVADEGPRYSADPEKAKAAFAELKRELH